MKYFPWTHVRDRRKARGNWEMARCEDWSKRQTGGQEEEQTADGEGKIWKWGTRWFGWQVIHRQKKETAKDTKGREMKSELDIVHFAAVSAMHENSQLKTDSKLVLKPKLAVPELNEWNEDLKTEEARKWKSERMEKGT